MSDANLPNVGTAAIRPLSSDDLPEICRLLSQRDERSWDVPSARWFLQDLDHDRCRAWGAFDGQRAVGLTNYFLRTLVWQGRPRRAAYWANLYIDPAYRQQMLYPRLPMVMLRDVAQANLEFLYAAVRLQNVAEAHRGLQFVEVGVRPVLVRLVRPGRFAAKYLGLPRWATPLATPLDLACRVAKSLQGRPGSGPPIQDVALTEAPLESFAQLLAERSADRISQPWTPQALRDRYRQTRERGAYRFMIAAENSAPAGGEPSLRAAAVYRLAERGRGIQAVVVMDAVYAAGRESDAQAVLNQLAAVAREKDCEILLYLDGLGEPMHRLATRCGFRPSPERYTLLVHPKSALSKQDWLADSDAWEFAFRDHDAF